MKNYHYYFGLSIALALIILISLFFSRCAGKKNNADVKPNILRIDTSWCVGTFASDTVNITTGPLRRLIFDAQVDRQIDATTIKRLWGKDTAYIIVLPTKIDSIESLIYPKAVVTRDSLGNYFVPKTYTYHKDFVEDPWGNLDSAVARIRRKIKR